MMVFHQTNNMGLEKKEIGNFITILGGKFCQKVYLPDNVKTPEEIEVYIKENNITKRVNKVNKTVYEKYYDSFTGSLVGIRTQDGEYGKNWLFDFRDSDVIYSLQLNYSNSFATALLKILPNIDLTKEMKVTPSVKEIDGKNRSTLFVNQDGVALKHAYTKDNPNGMPDLEQIVVKGEKVWDDTKRIAFLYNMVATTIIPKLKGIVGEVAVAPVKDADKAFEDLGKASEDITAEDVAF